jgi:hypothetical protein
VHARVHSGARPLTCELCDPPRAFRHSSSLAAHRRSHSGARPYRSAPPPRAPRRASPGAERCTVRLDSSGPPSTSARGHGIAAETLLLWLVALPWISFSPASPQWSGLTLSLQVRRVWPGLHVLEHAGSPCCCPHERAATSVQRVRQAFCTARQLRRT